MDVLHSLFIVAFLFCTPERHSRARNFTSWTKVLKISQDTNVTKYLLENLKNHSLKYIFFSNGRYIVYLSFTCATSKGKNIKSYSINTTFKKRGNIKNINTLKPFKINTKVLMIKSSHGVVIHKCHNKFDIRNSIGLWNYYRGTSISEELIAPFTESSFLWPRWR